MRLTSTVLSRSAWTVTILLLVALQPYAQTTERVSVNSAGVQGTSASFSGYPSAEGRYVVFYSYAPNLVAGDTNGTSDVFVHDRLTGDTTRVSVHSSGTQGNGYSSTPCISLGGRFVGFASFASNLVEGDTNGAEDAFVHDRQTVQTWRVSIDSLGVAGNNFSTNPSISADGRVVAFTSAANNLVSNDTNGCNDVFVHDRQTGATTRVSVDSAGNQGNSVSSTSRWSSISADGRYVTFQSAASNLVSGDTNAADDVFVHDRYLGETSRVSIDSSGHQANALSYSGSICGDGAAVAFLSGATNLVPGDTNGYRDVFVRDLRYSVTNRISVDSSGSQSDADSGCALISCDGRNVAFSSGATNLVVGDTNGHADMFLHDRQSGQTTRVSISSAGGQGNGPTANEGGVAADGRAVAFSSEATNLVSGDTNGVSDVFTRSTPSWVADLSVALADSPEPVLVNGALTLTGTVANAGPNTASGVLLTVALPPGSAFVSASGTSWTCGHFAGEVTCFLPSLAVGTPSPVTISATAPSVPGVVTTIATVGPVMDDPDPPDNSDSETTTVLAIPQRDALMALYNATGGPSWTIRTGWGTAAPVCSWYGVGCNAEGLVTSLALSLNHLVGSLPDSPWGGLVRLEHLYLDMNSLTGPIPSELRYLSGLRELWLHGNDLSGGITPELAELAALEFLDLHANRLSGTIPPQLGGIAGLRYLYLDGNQVEGPIPPELGSLNALRGLGLGSNQLAGMIPPQLGGLSQLEALFLDANLLSGTVPASLGSLSNLRLLYLNGNALAGELPGGLAGLTHLEVGGLDLRWNGLFTADPTLLTFLNACQIGNDVAGTQTVTVEGLTALAQGSGSVMVTWTPIGYTANLGGYRLYKATGPGGPFTLAGLTFDKTAPYLSAGSLSPGTTYWFRVEAFTDPHADNPNTAAGEPSVPASSPPGTPGQPGGLRFATATSQGSEGEAKVVTVWRLSGSTGAVTVHYATSPGTAVPGVDYQHTSGTLSWSTGDDAPKAFTVTLLDDSAPEGPETFNLALSSPGGGATLLSPSTAVLTLSDNDLASTAGVSSAGRTPSACVDGSGRRVVVWSAPGAADDLDVLMQRFDSGGLSMGPQARVNATTAGDQVGPSVACRADGSFVVTWVSVAGTDRQGAGIFGRLFGSGGTPITPDLPLNTLPLGDAVVTRVAVRPVDGGFFAVWQGTPSVRQSGAGIFGRLFTSSGGAGSPEITVDPGFSYAVSAPAVGVNDAGDAAVAWSREDTDGWNDVYMQRYSAGGTPVGTETLVNHDLFRNQEQPSVEVNDDGGVVVAWQGPSLPDAGGYRNPGSDVFARRYDPSGSPVGAVFRVNSAADGSQKSPHVVRNAAGDCFVGWEQEGSSGSVGVFGRHLSSCVSLVGDDVRVSAAGWRVAAQRGLHAVRRGRGHGGLRGRRRGRGGRLRARQRGGRPGDAAVRRQLRVRHHRRVVLHGAVTLALPRQAQRACAPIPPGCACASEGARAARSYSTWVTTISRTSCGSPSGQNRTLTSPARCPAP